MLAVIRRAVRLRTMADPTNPSQTPPPGVEHSPAAEAGPDLPDRTGVPDFVPVGKEDRWRNSEKVAQQLFPGDSEAIWQASRAIFNDPVSYPDELPGLSRRA